jgi:hypothetical protein
MDAQLGLIYGLTWAAGVLGTVIIICSYVACR